MKINIIAGFLGVGKTTMIRRTLERGLPAERVAVLVNEFGPIGLDGEVLRRGAVEMVQLASGCICCTLRGALAAAVRQIAVEIRPERLLIECTGVANPTDVLRTAAGASRSSPASCPRRWSSCRPTASSASRPKWASA